MTLVAACCVLLCSLFWCALALTSLMPYTWLVGVPRQVFWQFWLPGLLPPLFVLATPCLLRRNSLTPTQFVALACCLIYWPVFLIVTGRVAYSPEAARFCLAYNSRSARRADASDRDVHTKKRCCLNKIFCCVELGSQSLGVREEKPVNIDAVQLQREYELQLEIFRRKQELDEATWTLHEEHTRGAIAKLEVDLTESRKTVALTRVTLLHAVPAQVDLTFGFMRQGFTRFSDFVFVDIKPNCYLVGACWSSSRSAAPRPRPTKSSRPLTSLWSLWSGATTACFCSARPGAT